MQVGQNLWELLTERDLVDEERKSVRSRIRVTKARIRLAKGHGVNDVSLIDLLKALEYEQKTLITFARRLGEIDRQIAEITSEMEKSANRQEGVADED